MLFLENVWYRSIIRGVTLKIEQGITAIIGPNGAGKTTLLRIIARIIKPDKGKVKVPERIGASWQNPYYSFYKTTVREEVKFALRMARKSANEEYYLKKFGLIDLADLSPFKLSAGEARILSILLALIWDPDLLLIDEPTTGLDIYEKRKLITVLRQLNKPIIIASHDIDFVLEVADKVAVMNNGTLIAYGDTLDIFYSNVLETIGFPKPVAVLLGEALGERVRSVEECLHKYF